MLFFTTGSYINYDTRNMILTNDHVPSWSLVRLVLLNCFSILTAIYHTQVEDLYVYSSLFLNTVRLKSICDVSNRT